MSKDRQDQVVSTARGKRYLNVGCGVIAHQEWNNLDAAPAHSWIRLWEAQDPLPFAAGTFHAVYHSHFLEHLTRDSATRFLAECHRVLLLGGTMRLILPDMEYNAQLYLEALRMCRENGSPLDLEHLTWARLNLFDQMVRVKPGGEMLEFLHQKLLDVEFVEQTTGGDDARQMRKSATKSAKSLMARMADGIKNPRKATRHLVSRLRPPSPGERGELHRWGYDEIGLREMLDTAGFRFARRMDHSESSIPDFERFALDVGPDGNRKPHSLILEAQKV